MADTEDTARRRLNSLLGPPELSNELGVILWNARTVSGSDLRSHVQARYMPPYTITTLSVDSEIDWKPIDFNMLAILGWTTVVISSRQHGRIKNLSASGLDMYVAKEGNP